MRRIVLLALAVVACAGGPSSAQQYQDAAAAVNAASDAMHAAVSPSGATADVRRAAYGVYADALRTFAQSVDRINGDDEQDRAIEALVEATSAEEVAARTAASASDDGLAAAEVALSAAITKSVRAANLVRLKLGLPAA